jgi:hypothetical protein
LLSSSLLLSSLSSCSSRPSGGTGTEEGSAGSRNRTAGVRTLEADCTYVCRYNHMYIHMYVGTGSGLRKTFFSAPS